MLDYYDTIYRQAIKKLQNRSTRSYNEKDENIIDFSCAIITRENRDGTIEYQLVESSSIICATNQIKQRTDIITIQVDTHKLSNSYYLLKYADSLTYNLCNASIYDYTNQIHTEEVTMTNLPFIHYSNPQYQDGREQIVYGQSSEDLHQTYSDRLIDWTYKTKKEPNQSDIDYWENILEMALNKKVKIECVIGGCNQSNGYGYYIFGYKEDEQNNGQS